MCNLNMIPESELIEIEIIPTHTELELKLLDAEEFNYENQFNLPKINGNELKGDKTGTELGLVDLPAFNEVVEDVNAIKEDIDNVKETITTHYNELTNDIDDLSLLVETNTQNITNLNEEIEITSNNLEALTGDVENIAGELDNKQDILISGQNIKTINNQSILGEGNIDIQGGGASSFAELEGSPYDNQALANELNSLDIISLLVMYLQDSFGYNLLDKNGFTLLARR